jgi:hypothetical protein
MKREPMEFIMRRYYCQMKTRDIRKSKNTSLVTWQKADPKGEDVTAVINFMSESRAVIYVYE